MQKLKNLSKWEGWEWLWPGFYGVCRVVPNPPHIQLRKRAMSFIQKWKYPLTATGPALFRFGHEMCPSVSPDGKLFIFASDRMEEWFSTPAGDPWDGTREKLATYEYGNQNVTYMSADFIEKMRAGQKETGTL